MTVDAADVIVSTAAARTLLMTMPPVAAVAVAELVTLPAEDHLLSRSETRLMMLEATVRFIEAHNPPDPAP